MLKLFWVILANFLLITTNFSRYPYRNLIQILWSSNFFNCLFHLCDRSQILRAKLVVMTNFPSLPTRSILWSYLGHFQTQVKKKKLKKNSDILGNGTVLRQKNS